MKAPYKVDYSKYQNKLGFRNKLGRLIWNISYVFFFRPFAFRWFRKYRNFILNLFGASIHPTACVFASAKIWAPWNLTIKEFSLLGQRVRCYNPGKITLEDNCIVSENVFLCSASHDIYSNKHELITKPIVINDQAWIAADAYIGPGINIGQGAVVGARSVVTKDIPPWTIVGGNPAKTINNREIQD